MSKKHEFQIQGIYHKITVRFVTQKWLGRKIKDSGIMGCYTASDALIYVAKELAPPIRLHTLYHEISHHIVDVLNTINDEEHKCDILSTYLLKLQEDREMIEKNLNHLNLNQ